MFGNRQGHIKPSTSRGRSPTPRRINTRQARSRSPQVASTGLKVDRLKALDQSYLVNNGFKSDVTIQEPKQENPSENDYLKRELSYLRDEKRVLQASLTAFSSNQSRQVNSRENELLKENRQLRQDFQTSESRRLELEDGIYQITRDKLDMERNIKELHETVFDQARQLDNFRAQVKSLSTRGVPKNAVNYEQELLDIRSQLRTSLESACLKAAENDDLRRQIDELTRQKHDLQTEHDELMHETEKLLLLTSVKPDKRDMSSTASTGSSYMYTDRSSSHTANIVSKQPQVTPLPSNIETLRVMPSPVTSTHKRMLKRADSTDKLVNHGHSKNGVQQSQVNSTPLRRNSGESYLNANGPKLAHKASFSDGISKQGANSRPLSSNDKDASVVASVGRDATSRPQKNDSSNKAHFPTGARLGKRTETNDAHDGVGVGADDFDEGEDLNDLMRLAAAPLERNFGVELLSPSNGDDSGWEYAPL